MALRLLSIFAAFVLLMGGASLALPGRGRDDALETALRSLGIGMRLPDEACDVTWLMADHRALCVEFELYGRRYMLTAEPEDGTATREGAHAWRADGFLFSLSSADAAEDELRAAEERLTEG